MDFRMSQEHQDLFDRTLDFAQRSFSERAFQRDSYAWDSARVLAEQGMTGITIPEAYGGQGGSLLDAVVVMDAVSRVCPHSGDVLQATNFGAIRQIAELGDEALKADLLPKLIAGERLVGVGMSEPDAGSALTDLKTTAAYDGDSVVINGQKCWTTHGPELTDLVVWCRFGPRSSDIGAVRVPTDSPGFSRGPVERFMSGEQHCVSFLDNVRVSRGNVLGDHQVLGRLMSVFGVERLGNATRSYSLAHRAFQIAVEHAKERTQFDRHLSEFQGIQWTLAEMRTQLEAARLLIYQAATNASVGSPSVTEATMAKLFANQMAFTVANNAMQILGAQGYTKGSPIEYIVRRVRGWMIAGGTIEMLRNRVAEDVLGQRISQRPT